MSRILFFLITLGALAALVMVFLKYDVAAAVATGVVLALAGGATTIVLRLAGATQPDTETKAADATRAGAVEPAARPAAHDQRHE